MGDTFDGHLGLPVVDIAPLNPQDGDDVSSPLATAADAPALPDGPPATALVREAGEAKGPGGAFQGEAHGQGSSHLYSSVYWMSCSFREVKQTRFVFRQAPSLDAAAVLMIAYGPTNLGRLSGLSGKDRPSGK